MPLIRSILILAYAFCIACLSAQPVLQQARIGMLNGEVDRTLLLLRQELDKETSNTRYRARLLESLGEQYHRLSDIGEAKAQWDDALRIRQQLFGDSSAEAAVGYAYQARYHNYMADPQTDHRTLAWRDADRARLLIRRHKRDVTAYERVVILREVGYAYKVAFGFGDADKHQVLSRSRELFHEALRSATAARDTIWIAQITHDIGNTFNDEAGYYGSTIAPALLQAFVDSALTNYQRSIVLMQAIGMGTSEAVMMDHFTTALLLKSAYGRDGIPAATAAYDRALRTMLRQAGHPADVDPLLYDPRIVNKAQMVELYYLRSTAIAGYPDSPDVQQLRRALASIEAAVPYWQAMLHEYRSRDLHKVTGSYSHFPFHIGTRMLLDLYRATGDSSLLLKAIDWYDLNCDASEQRDMLKAGAVGTNAGTRSAFTGSPSLPDGVTCIAFHEHYSLSILCIDHRGPRILNAALNDARSFNARAAAHALRTEMERNDPRAYRKNAFAIYQATLGAALDQNDDRELVIVPGEALAGIPFEALVTDTLGEASWANMHYLMDRCSVRNARTIHEALEKPTGPFHTPMRLAISKAMDASALPFSEALVTSMHAQDPDKPLFQGVTRQDLFDLLNGEAPFHLASHAVSPKGADELPYLLLDDGPLSIRDIDSLGCAAPLVILSTCSGGEGRIYRGQGAISLGNAFLRGGADAVVQTLWPVDDQATSEVLGLMYAGMDDGLSVSDALCEAKRTFVKKHADDALSDPFYWSGIIVTGKEVRTSLPNRNRFWWTGGSAVFLLTIGAWRYKRSKRARSSPALPPS